MSKPRGAGGDERTARPVIGWGEMAALSAGDVIRVTWETADGEAKVRETEIATTAEYTDQLVALLAPDEWRLPDRRVVMDRDGTFTVEEGTDGNLLVARAWEPASDGPVTVHRID